LLKVLTASLIALAAGSCSTLSDLGGDGGPHVYGGTRGNIKSIHEPYPDAAGYVLLFCVCDFPWSLALDTGLLPITVVVELIRGLTADPPTPAPRTSPPEKE